MRSEDSLLKRTLSQPRGLRKLSKVLIEEKHDFGDEPYENGVLKLKEWERSVPQRCEKLLGESPSINPELVADNNNLFANAPFINKYRSMPHLLAATEDCTDAELMVGAM
jgi:hypothetical protein